MGQYYTIINLDKKEFLHPHKFGDGLKLLEFGMSAQGTMTALAVLLAEGNGRGGGDLRVEPDCPVADLVGSWSRDRIVVAGDYADSEDGDPQGDDTLYSKTCEGDDGEPAEFTDISGKALALLCEDRYFLRDLVKQVSERAKESNFWFLSMHGIYEALEHSKKLRDALEAAEVLSVLEKAVKREGARERK